VREREGAPHTHKEKAAPVHWRHRVHRVKPSGLVPQRAANLVACAVDEMRLELKPHFCEALQEVLRATSTLVLLVLVVLLKYY
jgi:hypothetical protein